MTDDRHDELAPATFERALDPRTLSVIHRAQDSRIYCNQCKVVGLQFKERRSLASGLDAVQTAHALGVCRKPVDAARICARQLQIGVDPRFHGNACGLGLEEIGVESFERVKPVVIAGNRINRFSKPLKWKIELSFVVFYRSGRIDYV